MSDDEARIERVQTVLYRSETPMALTDIEDEIDVDGRAETKRLLRTMIDRGMIATTPGFKYRLSASVRRSMEDDDV